jgi:hypothetical protein
MEGEQKEIVDKPNKENQKPTEGDERRTKRDIDSKDILIKS